MSNNKGNNKIATDKIPAWEEVKAGNWEVTLFPVARKSKTGKKGITCSETYAPAVLRVDGKKGKHLLTAFSFLDIPNGTREKMIIWAVKFAEEQGLNCRAWITEDYASARDKIISRLRNANKRAQKTINEGLGAFVEKAKERAEEKFAELPDDITERNEKIAELEGSKAEGVE